MSKQKISSEAQIIFLLIGILAICLLCGTFFNIVFYSGKNESLKNVLDIFYDLVCIFSPFILGYFAYGAYTTSAEQLQEQREQFAKQSFDDKFFKLLDYFKESSYLVIFSYEDHETKYKSLNAIKKFVIEKGQLFYNIKTATIESLDSSNRGYTINHYGRFLSNYNSYYKIGLETENPEKEWSNTIDFIEVFFSGIDFISGLDDYRNNLKSILLLMDYQININKEIIEIPRRILINQLNNYEKILIIYYYIIDSEFKRLILKLNLISLNPKEYNLDKEYRLEYLEFIVDKYFKMPTNFDK